MTTHVAMLFFPDITQLDLTGPLEVLSRIPDVEIHVVWKTLDPVRRDRGDRLRARVLSEIAGERTAKLVELGLEYDPAPPYRCGHPDIAAPELVAAARAALARS